jgi:hypothetical protein
MTLTHDSGDGLRPLLAEAVSDRPAGTDLLAGVRRARRRRRVLVQAGSLATAGALGAAALVVWPLGGTPSAQARLVAAVEHTSGQGFHVHIVSGPTGAVYDGAFDPGRQTGRLVFPGGGQDLYVGDTVYTENTGPKAETLPAGKHWISSPRTTMAEWARMGTAIEVLKLGPQEPQLVLRQLRSATNVRETGPASGPQWTGHRYSFTVAGEADAKRQGLTVTGTVAVDSHDLVRVLDLTVRPQSPANSKGAATHSVIEFSGYGAPVDVAAPPADQVIGVEKVQPPRSGKYPHKTVISKSPGA